MTIRTQFIAIFATSLFLASCQSAPGESGSEEKLTCDSAPKIGRFDPKVDLLIANYDSKPDVDDPHAASAVLSVAAPLRVHAEKDRSDELRAARGRAEAHGLWVAPHLQEIALDRLDGPLTQDQQRTVLAATRTPHKVKWPNWWSVFQE